MLNISDTDAGKAWVSQFKIDDQALAMKLIDGMSLVSHDDFIERMRDLILLRAEKSKFPIGLYAEREVQKWNGNPNRLLKETKGKKNRRAYGGGPMPVAPMRRDSPSVGSEGLVSWLITELCREYPKNFISHPGPNKIRKEKVRKFIIVTDFIGSGQRAFDYLQSAWRVASVKSWRSYKLIQFEVLAYSGTDIGVKVVKKHKSHPAVDLVMSCPIIDSEFNHELANKLRQVCRHYDPIDHDDIASLGYKGTGALLAFSHGCPNNVPRLIHKKGKNWSPLFPARVTAKVRSIFGDREGASALHTRLEMLGEKYMPSEAWVKKTTVAGRKMLLLLTTLKGAPRFDEALSRKTRLIIPEIRLLVQKAQSWGLIDEERRLTKEGSYQLKHARSYKRCKTNLTSEANQMYYPKSLRVPYNASS